MCRFFRQDVASLTKREASRRYMTGGGCSCRAGRAGRDQRLLAGRGRQGRRSGLNRGLAGSAGVAGTEGAGTEEAQLDQRWPLEPKGGAGAKGEGEGRGRKERAKGEGERRGRKERAKGEGGACHGARTKVSGQKARWRLAGGRWAHEGAGCKCGPDNADKTQSIYRAIKKPPLLGTGAWGITCPEAGERFIRSDDDQKK